MIDPITLWLSGVATGISLTDLSRWIHRRRRPRPSAPGPWDPQAIYLEPPSTPPHHTLNRD